ncbi:DUF151 domain-containing protein [Halosquirtibacter xylanolyticus]|uniref:bifunctional nuclease family protein n=1 Tax=Halosquirtibacter xylanolyticus TaxID=3374599 RepID=UPI003747BB0C|nr:DUF151 domain-containing protein [Prolixibacteraceae bacterium]
MQKIKLRILGLTTSQTQTGAYALLMTEVDGSRRLPIIIGAIEAQAIVIHLEQMSPPRPLTHDLFHQSLMSFGVNLEEVQIYKLDDGIYFSKLIYKRDNKIEEVESRTSDAIALALRFTAPIYIDSDIMDRASISFEIKEQEEVISPSESVVDSSEVAEESVDDRKDRIASANLEDLEMYLQKAIEEEDYELASLISDEVKKRKDK